jgi:hypothetical protein
MNGNPNIFRNAEVIGVENALLDKLAAIEKQHPRYFKDKAGTLKNQVNFTYPSKNNDYQFHFGLAPHAKLPPPVKKKILAAFEELKADLASRSPNQAHSSAGTIYTPSS